MINIKQYLETKGFGQYKVSPKGELTVQCPFHEDKNPSFSINVETGLWICRSASCGLKGSFPLFYKLMEGIESWSEVGKKIGKTSPAKDFNDLFGFSSQKNIGIKYQPLPSEVFREDLGHHNFPIWLSKRRYSFEDVEQFGLKIGVGGEYRNRLILPYYGFDGNLLTFSARIMENNSKWGVGKYLFPEDSPKSSLLYGVNLLRNSNSLKYLWIVEGPFDVIRLSTFKEKAVALSGCEMSSRQFLDICKLVSLTGAIPVVLLDADAHRKAEKIYYELVASNISPKLAFIPLGKDPDDLYEEDFNSLSFA